MFQEPRNQVYFRMSFKHKEGRVRRGKEYGTFFRELMLPELLWLFITPGKCELCYFLIRLVLGVEKSALDSYGREHLAAQLVLADRCYPPAQGEGTWGMSDHLWEERDEAKRVRLKDREGCSQPPVEIHAPKAGYRQKAATGPRTSWRKLCT